MWAMIAWKCPSQINRELGRRLTIEAVIGHWISDGHLLQDYETAAKGTRY